MTFCQHCGASVDGLKFCGQCGRSLQEDAATPKKKSLSFADGCLLTFAAVVLLAMLGAWLGGSGDPAVPSGQPPIARKAWYFVSGTADLAHVTYTNGTGGTEQRDIGVPWTTEISAAPRTHLYISAQNKSDTGTVIVEIYIEGQGKKQAESSGAYVIAQTAATVN